jgi:hypothetical protein
MAPQISYDLVNWSQKQKLVGPVSRVSCHIICTLNFLRDALSLSSSCSSPHTAHPSKASVTHFKPVTAFWYFEGAPEMLGSAELWQVQCFLRASDTVWEPSDGMYSWNTESQQRHYNKAFGFWFLSLSLCACSCTCFVCVWGVRLGVRVKQKDLLLFSGFLMVSSSSATLRKL